MEDKKHLNYIIGWDETDDETRRILGMPNFSCGQVARKLREMGYKCEEKAEAEQALVIHLMLVFKNEYGENWIKEFFEYIKIS